MKNILISSPDPHLWYILSISIYSITVKNMYLETYLILMNSLSPTLRVCLHWEIVCMFLHCWLPGRTHEWPLKLTACSQSVVSILYERKQTFRERQDKFYLLPPTSSVTDFATKRWRFTAFNLVFHSCMGMLKALNVIWSQAAMDSCH